jgi:hyperosmotically inducible periplasmic protein
MKKTTLLLATLIVAGGSGDLVYAQYHLHSPLLAQAAPDNTGKNVRDSDGGTVTPLDQSSDPADVELTRRIREAVVADSSLSTNAHNVKIVTANGVVTLRGPVGSMQEKTKVAETARKLAGKYRVENQLEVTSK